MRDLFTKKVDRLLIDSKQDFEEVKDFVRRYLPEQASRVHHYEKKDEGLFDYLGIELEIARALSRKVWLKSGGHIVVDHTEAMTVVDVNTGRFVGKRDQEETILKNNLEAAKEIAYQIKLRGIGGALSSLILSIWSESEIGIRCTTRLLRQWLLIKPKRGFHVFLS